MRPMWKANLDWARETGLDITRELDRSNGYSGNQRVLLQTVGSIGPDPRLLEPVLSLFVYRSFKTHVTLCNYSREHCECTDPNVDSRRGSHCALLDRAAWECPPSRERRSRHLSFYDSKVEGG
ncbi:hypothetical protein CRG98_043146 [Punica granatum]|uniref:Uncharacterized protein n=1 Tax=Punica granatum TaxID=22663 RepID=A0A2I0HXN6_PUNGR|nr:hypothetical protein CRG98_043146 [Punica granatum]